MGEEQRRAIAYFSMEFAFNKEIPNYAGGLGVLAADMMHSCADLGTPAVGVSLIYHQDDDPTQAWDPSPFMRKREETVKITIEDRTVHIAIWQMDITGTSGHVVPIIFLSTYVPENTDWDRDITRHIYSSHGYTRLCQEAVLGIGGYRALKKLGYDKVTCYHMNEGHTAFVGIERLRTNAYNEEKVRNTQTFTTHTPVPAGHDYFDYDMAYQTIGAMLPSNIRDIATHDRLGMTQLAMNLAKKTNSVSERHNEVCHQMFPEHQFENVTNGIYHLRWAGDAMAQIFDKHIAGWRENPGLLREAPSRLPNEALRNATQVEKRALMGWINSNHEFLSLPEIVDDDLFQEDVLTIGFARRFVPYKRPGLIFTDIDELRRIGYRKLQIIIASRCHPQDAFCNNLRSTIRDYSRAMRGQVRIAVIPHYDLGVAKRLVTGVDVWLNTPVSSREASGTSGMKAALNGALNLSTLDGWWIEGLRREPLSGWGFEGAGPEQEPHGRDVSDAQKLYAELKKAITCYTTAPDEWLERKKHAIALMDFFNTHRVINEYKERVWCCSRDKE